MTVQKENRMQYIWEDLPKKKTLFTVRNATMRNLNTGEIVQHYATNTHIDVVQKCVTEKATYYRTQSAEHHNLNWAFEASAFGLPNELAPSEPSSLSPKLINQPDTRSLAKTNNQKEKQTKGFASEDGEKRKPFGILQKIFRRKNS